VGSYSGLVLIFLSG